MKVSNGLQQPTATCLTFPFRLGCTSYVYPDAILPNVRQLAPIVDDIELVLFESGDTCNYPSSNEIEELRELGRRHDCTYTVHFPIDCRAGADDPRERAQFVRSVERIADLCAPLDPYAWILHFEGVWENTDAPRADSRAGAFDDVCRKISGNPLICNEKVCVETLAYPPEWHDIIVGRYGFSLCMDVGHLVLNHRNWEQYWRAHRDGMRVIHYHGVHEKTDHISIKNNDISMNLKFISLLREIDYSHVVTLELFSQQDTFESVDLIGQLWDRSL